MASTTYKFYSSKNNADGENGAAEISSSASTATTSNSSTIIPSRKSDFFNNTILKNGKKTNSLNTSRLNSKHIASAKKKAMNASVMRQTLRSNNKALARALEMAKNEIKLLKEENLLLKSTNQELQAQLLRHQDIDSFEELFEKAVDECVKTKLAEIFADVEILVDETAQTLAKQTNCLSEISKICKKHTEDGDESTSEVKRASSVDSSGDEFVRRYSLKQPTIFGGRRSMAIDKQVHRLPETSNQASNSTVEPVEKPVEKPAGRRSDLFKRPAEPIIRKNLDLSTLLEQSSVIDASTAAEEDIVTFVPLEPVCESPKDVSPQRTSSDQRQGASPLLESPKELPVTRKRKTTKSGRRSSMLPRRTTTTLPVTVERPKRSVAKVCYTEF